jgi:ankyrin repeat protein
LIFSYPCLRTVRILLQCGADANANNIERATPLHVFVSNAASCNDTILQLLCDAGAHLDYANELGETAVDIAFNTNIKQLLQAKLRLSLKCLCARLIQKAKVPFHGKVSNLLVAFIERH